MYQQCLVVATNTMAVWVSDPDQANRERAPERAPFLDWLSGIQGSQFIVRTASRELSTDGFQPVDLFIRCVDDLIFE
jgi:hypothetical protein